MIWRGHEKLDFGEPAEFGILLEGVGEKGAGGFGLELGVIFCNALDAGKLLGEPAVEGVEVELLKLELWWWVRSCGPVYDCGSVETEE